MIWSVRDRFFGEVTFACIDQHFFGGADFFLELDADELFLFGGGAVSRVMLFLKKNITVVETREDRLMLTRNGDYIQIGGKFPRLGKSEEALSRRFASCWGRFDRG